MLKILHGGISFNTLLHIKSDTFPFSPAPLKSNGKTHLHESAYAYGCIGLRNRMRFYPHPYARFSLYYIGTMKACMKHPEKLIPPPLQSRRNLRDARPRNAPPAQSPPLPCP